MPHIAPPTKPKRFSELEPRRYKRDRSEQLARLLDFAQAGGVQLVEQYLAEIEATVTHYSTLTDSERIKRTKAYNAVAILNGEHQP